MNVTIDGDFFPIPEEVTDREELWFLFEQEAERRGRVVVDVLSDGEALGLKDFLTIPEEVDLQVLTGTPYDVACELLGVMVRETQGIDEAAKRGELYGAYLTDTFRWLEQALNRLKEAFPEWLAADALSDALEQIKALLEGACGDLPPAADLAPALDAWSLALIDGVNEMEDYHSTDAFDETGEEEASE